jgi:energy-coupling factor transport system ATP-binding protein
LWVRKFNPPVITVENVTFAYPTLQPDSDPLPILKNCSLRIEEGMALAVMGPSGAGKSTLGYLLAGLAPRLTGGTVSGTVALGEHNVLTTPPDIGTVGLLFQDAATQLFNTTVEDEIAWGLEALGLSAGEITQRVENALVRFNLVAARFRAPWTLSGGQQKRLALAALWAMRPSVLILDEPLGGLDPQGKAEVMMTVEALRRAGTSLLLTTLHPQTARRTGHISLLADGQLTPPKHANLVLEDDGPLIASGLIYPTNLWPDLSPIATPDQSVPAIEIRGLCFSYTDREKVLRGIDLTIPPGQFIALVGPNGAGKSTFARHLNGLLRARHGTVRVQGKLVGNRPTGALARSVGYLFQRPEQQFFAPTVRKELAFGLTQLGITDMEARLDHVLARFGLTELADTPPAMLGYGAQRTVTLASLAAMNPPIVVLDEPTVGLDGRGLAQLLAWLSDLRASGTTIILVTHEMDLACRADRAITIDHGRVIADGDPATVLDNEPTWGHEL